MTDEEALQTAVKCIIDSVGPDGLILTLLVYGAIPRLGIPYEKPAQNIYQQASALRKATEEIPNISQGDKIARPCELEMDQTHRTYTIQRSTPTPSYILYRPTVGKDHTPFSRLKKSTVEFFCRRPPAFQSSGPLSLDASSPTKSPIQTRPRPKTTSSLA